MQRPWSPSCLFTSFCSGLLVFISLCFLFQEWGWNLGVKSSGIGESCLVFSTSTCITFGCPSWSFSAGLLSFLLVEGVVRAIVDCHLRGGSPGCCLGNTPALNESKILIKAQKFPSSCSYFLVPCSVYFLTHWKSHSTCSTSLDAVSYTQSSIHWPNLTARIEMKKCEPLQPVKPACFLGYMTVSDY